MVGWSRLSCGSPQALGALCEQRVGEKWLRTQRRCWCYLPRRWAREPFQSLPNMHTSLQKYGIMRVRGWDRGIAGPTLAARRAVIYRVESEWERFDCISDTQKNRGQSVIATTCGNRNFTKKSRPCTSISCRFELFLFCAFVLNELKHQGPTSRASFAWRISASVIMLTSRFRLRMEKWPCRAAPTPIELALWYQYVCPLPPKQLTWTKHRAGALQIFSSAQVFLQVDPQFRIGAIQKETENNPV